MEVTYGSRPHKVKPSYVNAEDASHIKDPVQLLSANTATQEGTSSEMEVAIGKMLARMKAKEEIVEDLRSTNAYWQDRVKQLESQIAERSTNDKLSK